MLSLTTFLFSFLIKFLSLDKIISKYIDKKDKKNYINSLKKIEVEMGEMGLEDNQEADTNLINI